MFRKIGLPLLLASGFALSPVVLAADSVSTSDTATMDSNSDGTAAATPMAANDKAPEWQGFHVGLNAIYAMGASDLNSDVSDGNGDEFGGEGTLISTFNQLGQEHSKAGDLTGGVDAGYDWQIKCLVFGLDAELTSLALSESSNGIVIANDGDYNMQDNQSLRTDWSAALRPHIGVAFGDFLVEGNAGVSVIHATYNENFTDMWEEVGEGVADSRYMIAPVFGAGARYHITPNWVAKADFSFAKYEQCELSSQSVQEVDPPAGPSGDSLWHSFDLTVETLSLGLDYQF
jgi:opacity protein-like surface antigen